jgi:hypothetical protein
MMSTETKHPIRAHIEEVQAQVRRGEGVSCQILLGEMNLLLQEARTSPHEQLHLNLRHETPLWKKRQIMWVLIRFSNSEMAKMATRSRISRNDTHHTPPMEERS